MRPSEIRERTNEELQQLGKDLRRELWKARFNNHTHQLDDTSKIRQLRKDVARVESIIRERTGAAEAAPAAEGTEE